jgi:hypothetical protein
MAVFIFFAVGIAAVAAGGTAGPTLRVAECSSAPSQAFYNGTEDEILAKVAIIVFRLHRSQPSSLLL